ncbi:MAG TPA: hypothetical protein VFM25_11360 [Verrucomicrobiae bacterium]|nr:hypothetical protein [Verrucomicrobiae bacterium]
MSDFAAMIYIQTTEWRVNNGGKNPAARFGKRADECESENLRLAFGKSCINRALF